MTIEHILQPILEARYLGKTVLGLKDAPFVVGMVLIGDDIGELEVWLRGDGPGAAKSFRQYDRLPEVVVPS